MKHTDALKSDFESNPNFDQETFSVTFWSCSNKLRSVLFDKMFGRVVGFLFVCFLFLLLLLLLFFNVKVANNN